MTVSHSYLREQPSYCHTVVLKQMYIHLYNVSRSAHQSEMSMLCHEIIIIGYSLVALVSSYLLQHRWNLASSQLCKNINEKHKNQFIDISITD